MTNQPAPRQTLDPERGGLRDRADWSRWRNPEHWRSSAAWTRLAAECILEARAKAHQLRLAESYERFAAYAEERIAAEKARAFAGEEPVALAP